MPSVRWKLQKIATLILFGICLTYSSYGQDLIELGNVAVGGTSWAINQSDEVAGVANFGDSDNNSDATLYSNGTLHNLGTLPNEDYSEAYDINDSGEVVGFSSGNYMEQAFLYSNGVMQSLGTFGGAPSIAYGINDSGEIVGEYSPNTNTTITGAFIYSGGVVQTLGNLGGNQTEASAINNLGQVVGTATTSTGAYVMFLYSGGHMTNLGAPVGSTFIAERGINASGQILCTAEINGKDLAFLYSNGKFQSLGSLGGGSSTGSGLNDAGTVVGYSQTSGSSQPEAFIYTSSGGMQELNSLYSNLLVSGKTSQSGFTDLSFAAGITDAGDIAGQGLYWNGTTSSNQSFLLQVAPTPEPPIYCLLGLGGCVLVLLKGLRPLRFT